MTKLYKKLIKNKKKAIALVVILVWAFIISNIINDDSTKKESYLAAELNAFSSKIDTTLKTYEKFSDYVFNRVINTPEILELLWSSKHGTEDEQNVIRQELYQILKPEYELLLNYDYRQLHIHTFDGNSFLRMHIPEKFGDNLMEIRDSINIANTEHKYVFGFEEGRIFNGYRFVYPLEYNNEHLGSVEVSVSMATIITILRELYPEINSSFVIAENVVRETVWDDLQDNYTEHPYLKGYLLDKEISNENEWKSSPIDLETQQYLSNQITKIKSEELINKDSFSEIINFMNKDYLVNFLAIQNIASERVAYVIGISEIKDYYGIYDNLLLHITLITLIAIVLLTAIMTYMKKQEILEKYSSVDHLTTIYNRFKFMDIAEKRLKNCDLESSIIILDIDHFKKVNDEYGHNVGDEVLKKIALTFIDQIRGQDIFGRWGGEEFIILLPKSSLEIGVQVAERLRKTIEDIDFYPVGKVTASFGVAPCKDFESIQDSIHMADQAMYDAKENGRNKVVSSRSF